MADKRVIHERDETLGSDGPNSRIIATDVEVADSTISQAKGLMGRSSLPEDFALSLEVGDGGLLPIPRGPSRQIVHMLFVRVPLDVIWVVDDEVIKTKTLKPWRGIGVGKADRILELPAGNAEGVKPGDTVRLVDAADVDQEEIAEDTDSTNTDSEGTSSA